MIKKTGVHGLAMGQLSKDSGIAAGTFYHYFDSKEMMLMETFLYCHKRAAAVGAKAIKSDDSYKNRFMSMVNAFYEHFSRYSVEVYFIQESESGFSVTNNGIRESRVYYNEVFHFLNQGVEKGTLRNIDSKLMLQTIFQNIFAVMKYETIFETKFTPSELNGYLEMAWHALKEREK